MSPISSFWAACLGLIVASSNFLGTPSYLHLDLLSHQAFRFITLHLDHVLHTTNAHRAA